MLTALYSFFLDFMGLEHLFNNTIKMKPIAASSVTKDDILSEEQVE